MLERDDVLTFLREAGLLGEGQEPSVAALEGGVSSDIWRVDTTPAPVCVKRALPKLKVVADWRAPIERNAYEVAWIELAREIEPASAPRVVAHDPGRGMFAMEYLDSAEYALWKNELRDGRPDSEFAARVGTSLGRIHDGTAGRPEIADRFQTDEIFYDIRLEPYLEATAMAHPDRAEQLRALIDVTADTRRALVHGDVSPKNILVAPHGAPVFLDAECAWYGDPAFDLAFCLNHLLLKCLWAPAARPGFFASFEALSGAYLAEVSWEDRAALESRTARLLPGLFLGRVDGKSPVEYITDEADRDAVRRVARRLLVEPVARLADVAGAWRRELESA